MKKLFTLLTLLVAIVTGAWGETVTVTLTGSKTKDAATTAFVPTITSSNANITTGTCGSSCEQSGYILSTAGNKTFTYDEEAYYLCHVYKDGSKAKLSDSGSTNQYGTFTVAEGYKYTVSRIDYVLATNSINVNDVIIIKDASSNNKYSSGDISVEADASPVSGSKNSLSTELTEGTYTINLNMSNSNTSTGKYFGFAKIIITGNLEVVRTVTDEEFSGVKVDGEVLSASKYDVEGNVITLKDSYILAPTVNLINTVTYSDESELEKDVKVSLAKNNSGTFFEGTATIGNTEYTVKVPVNNTVSLSEISWEFASQENSTTMPVCTETEKIASSTYTLGGNVAFEANADHCFVDSEGEDDVNVSRVKPSEASENTVLFTVTPTLGVSFIPTGVSFVAMKQGTNGEVTLNAAWVSSGQDDITLVSNAPLKRASSSGTYAKPGGDRFTYNLASKGASAATGTFGLKLTLNTASKSYGIGEIKIQGYFTGEPVTTDVSVGAKGFATYCNSDYALDFTGKSIEAYTVSSNGASLTLTKKQKVAKGEPVLLYSKTASDIQMIPAIAESEASADNTNKLVAGNGTPITWTDNNPVYILYTGGATPGFYRANNSTVAANKAYLNLGAAGARAVSFILNMDDSTTAISEVATEEDDKSAPVYDLQGRRVAQPAKGLYIVNGKKVIIK